MSENSTLISKEKLKNIFKTIIPISISILSTAIVVVRVFLNYVYSNRCEKFYGLHLDCFKLGNEYINQVIIVIIMIIMIVTSLFLFSKTISKNKVAFVVGYTIINGSVILLSNLLIFVCILKYEINEKTLGVLEFFNIHPTITMIILIVISFLLSFSISIIILMSKSEIKYTGKFINTVLPLLTVIVAIVEIIIIVYFSICLLNPTPQTKHKYTTITCNINSDEQNETYIIVGNYNNDFVVMEIQNATINNNEIDLQNFSTLNDAIIEINKGDYKIIKPDNNMMFNDVLVKQVIVTDNDSIT